MKLLLYDICVYSLELLRLLLYYISIPFVPFIKRAYEAKMKSVDVIVNGSRKWDIRVKDERFWRMFVSAGVIGFVDAYQNGYFECDDLCELCYRLTKMDLNKYSIFHPYYYFNCDLEYYFGIQNSDSAYKDGGEGYDKYNDYIEKYTFENKSSSCPYYKDAQTLNDATQKMRQLIARKLKIKSKMRILDIGCGYGGLAKYLADNFDVEVVGYTNSMVMAKKASEYCSDNNRIQIHCMDFREMVRLGSFDRIVCVQMIEHIGVNNYSLFFKLVKHALKDNGLFLLQTLALNNSYYPNGCFVLHRYMGINYSCPNMNQIVKYTEKLFVVEDWQNYGNHMAIASQQIYEKNKKLKIVLMKEFGEKMFNVWQIVFAISYALYRTRQSHVWQIIFSKSGIEGGYDSEH